MRIFNRGVMLLFVLSLLLTSGCNAIAGTRSGVQTHVGLEIPEIAPVVLGPGEKLDVVATTSIVADVVKQVGGDNINLKILMPPGIDPHAFEPTPQDIAAVADAHIVYSNGFGLEGFLDTLIANAGGHTPVVPVSIGISALEGIEHTEDAEGDPGHADDEVDPHTWFDPNNVIVWTQHIQSTLQALDPDNAALYAQRSESYQRELNTLDTWIMEQVNLIPAANRNLVTDHEVFRYFAMRYGFEQIGTVVPGYNASAQPSAQALAELERAIETHHVEAIFVGTTVNPDLAQQIARDVGIQLVILYTGSLSELEGDAGSYIDFMRYNTQAIVDALK